jgi:F0F1-type ATP synthase membrane subunit b/b'
MTHKKKLTLIKKYNKIKGQRSRNIDENLALEERKTLALEAALTTVHKRFEYAQAKVNTKRTSLNKQMEKLLEEVYKLDEDLAAEMAIGKEIHEQPTDISNEPTATTE